MKTLTTILLAAGLVLALAPAAQAATMSSELGILDLNANSGNNPATAAPWAPGDTYRFAFTSSELTPATSTDINYYNTFVQNLANDSPLNIGAAQGVTWKVIGSTATVDARDNTSTNTAEDGTGESIFLLDGVTRVATDYAALWGFQTHDAGLDQTERLTDNPSPADYGQVWTGTDGYGEANADFELGSVDGKARTGLPGFTSGRHWIMRFDMPTETGIPVYGLSEPLEIVPEPATMVLIGLGGIGLLLRRRRA